MIKQTFSDWELIIWDDGSTDQTEEVVKSFQDQRISYYSDCNRGMSYALNQAILKAKAGYLAFLDDDDQWIDNKLELQLSIIAGNPEIDMIFGNYLNTDYLSQKENLGFQQNKRGISKLNKVKIGKESYIIHGGFLEAITTENFIAFDSVLMRKSIYQTLGKFNEHLRNGMDFEYWWKFGLFGGKAAFTEEAVLNRIKYAGSLSSSSLETYNNYLDALDSCCLQAIKAGRKDLIMQLNRL